MIKILRYESNTELPESLISDLQIDKILPRSAQRILRRPCGASEIPNRLELFSLLDGELKTELAELLSSLREYARALERLHSVSEAHERLCLRLAIYENYLKILQKITSLGGKGALLSEFAEYYSALLPEELGEDLCRARRLLERVSSFYFLNSDKLWVSPASPDATLNERFDLLAQELSLPHGNAKEQKLALPASVSDALIMLFPDEFAEIRSCIDKYFTVDLNEVTAHIPELEFILAISDLIGGAGIPYCLPEISSSPEFTADSLYDVSLTAKGIEILPNDAEFSPRERFFFLTGANGGGKTTYARALGINLLLFLSGCPVFAKSARIYPFSSVLSHFPADERFAESGRLDDELRRSERILADAGEIPFLIYNETFSGTDEERGYSLLCSLAHTLRERGAFGIFVTHFHRVSELGFPMLTAEVDAEKENARTYRIRRTNVSRSSFAEDILKKYRLDKRSLAERGMKK